MNNGTVLCKGMTEHKHYGDRKKKRERRDRGLTGSQEEPFTTVS